VGINPLCQCLAQRSGTSPAHQHRTVCIFRLRRPSRHRCQSSPLPLSSFLHPFFIIPPLTTFPNRKPRSVVNAGGSRLCCCHRWKPLKRCADYEIPLYRRFVLTRLPRNPPSNGRASWATSTSGLCSSNVFACHPHKYYRSICPAPGLCASGATRWLWLCTGTQCALPLRRRLRTSDCPIRAPRCCSWSRRLSHKPHDTRALFGSRYMRPAHCLANLNKNQSWGHCTTRVADIVVERYTVARTPAVAKRHMPHATCDPHIAWWTDTR
jgi:hypothetical protein